MCLNGCMCRYARVFERGINQISLWKADWHKIQKILVWVTEKYVKSLMLKID